jgi:hypothetical protein
MSLVRASLGDYTLASNVLYKGDGITHSDVANSKPRTACPGEYTTAIDCGMVRLPNGQINITVPIGAPSYLIGNALVFQHNQQRKSVVQARLQAKLAQRK